MFINTDVYAVLAIASLCVFLLGFLLVVTVRWHGHVSMDQASGIQKIHTQPTPRIGGLSIAVGLVVAAILMPKGSAQQILTAMLMAGAPALVAGLAEDFTKKVNVTTRLLATMFAGALAWWLTGYSLTRLDLPLLDALLQITMVSILLTAFAVGGVANAINIIDGFNGLASITSILAFVGFAAIASMVGDNDIALVAAVFSACVFGFLLINWPWGKLFLGDGGAYYLGFALAWIAVMLVWRNSNVSAFSALVICAHPINEVLFTIYRRTAKQAHPGMPDRLHFHSLVSRRYVQRWLASAPSWMQNSATGLLVSFSTLVSIMVAMFSYSSTRLSIISYVLISLCHFILYIRIVRHSWRFDDRGK